MKKNKNLNQRLDCVSRKYMNKEDLIRISISKTGTLTLNKSLSGRGFWIKNEEESINLFFKRKFLDREAKKIGVSLTTEQLETLRKEI